MVGEVIDDRDASAFVDVGAEDRDVVFLVRGRRGLSCGEFGSGG